MWLAQVESKILEPGCKSPRNRKIDCLWLMSYFLMAGDFIRRTILLVEPNMQIFLHASLRHSILSFFIPAFMD